MRTQEEKNRAKEQQREEAGAAIVEESARGVKDLAEFERQFKKDVAAPQERTPDWQKKALDAAAANEKQMEEEARQLALREEEQRLIRLRVRHFSRSLSPLFSLPPLTLSFSHCPSILPFLSGNLDRSSLVLMKIAARSSRSSGSI